MISVFEFLAEGLIGARNMKHLIFDYGLFIIKEHNLQEFDITPIIDLDFSHLSHIQWAPSLYYLLLKLMLLLAIIFSQA